mgnify:CR=1 FL=1|tara:strand:+ start:518 stop:826 length:309 start_codon:yes stop_codon:yes gene_type:complete
MKITYKGTNEAAVHALAPIAINICKEYYSRQKSGMDKTCEDAHKTLTIISSMHSAFISERFHEGEYQAALLRKHLHGGGVAVLLLNFWESCADVQAMTFAER